MENNFRAFLAIDLSDEAKNAILKVQKILQKELEVHKKSFNKIRWTKPDNLHITLRFLGNISEEQANNIILETQNIDEKILSVKLSKIMVFPSVYRPRMLVVNIEPNEQLKKIWQFLNKIALDNKIAPDNHPFTPHLTLCRFECNHKFPAIVIPKIKIANFIVNAVKLFRSDPGISGSKYTLINSFPLSYENN